MPPGVRGRSTDGRLTVDATVPVMMARARAALLPDVAALLRDPAFAMVPAPDAGTDRRLPGPEDGVAIGAAAGAGASAGAGAGVAVAAGGTAGASR